MKSGFCNMRNIVLDFVWDNNKYTHTAVRTMRLVSHLVIFSLYLLFQIFRGLLRCFIKILFLFYVCRHFSSRTFFTKIYLIKDMRYKYLLLFLSILNIDFLLLSSSPLSFFSYIKHVNVILFNYLYHSYYFMYICLRMIFRRRVLIMTSLPDH